MLFRSRIELERRKKGLTLRRLGEVVKISASELSRIEKGKAEPFPSHLHRLSAFFRIEGAELLKEVK